MNAFQANERLRILNNAIWALETAISDANGRQDLNGRHALGIVMNELQSERDELQRKLFEIEI